MVVSVLWIDSILQLSIIGPMTNILFLLALLSIHLVASFFVATKSEGARRCGLFRPALGAPICEYHQVNIPTSQSGPPRQAVFVEDLTPVINNLLISSGMTSGTVSVISRHTTTAITINERESRLARDMEVFFLRLTPPDERSGAKTAVSGIRYEHNDIDKRPESSEEAARCRENGWDIDNPSVLQAWRDQEPINAHSHLISMLLGSSESIPVVEGAMVIGQWQSVLLVDLDGPRDRTVGIQLNGYHLSF
jgi:thiamine phosphate synthase YjbQ (UPF0047 family)